MTAPIITDRHPGELTLDENGYHGSRAWDIIAASEIDALNILRAQRRVYRGAVYRNAYGQTPDSRVKCQSLKAVGHPPAPVGGTGLYEVTAEYAQRSSSAGGGTKKAEVGGPPVWSVDTAEASRPVDRDRSGFPITNVVEEPIEPALTINTTTETLVVRFYVTSANQLSVYSTYRPYKDTVNSATYKGIPRGCLLCRGFTPATEEDGLFLVTGKFMYRPQVTALRGINAYYTQSSATANNWVSISLPIEGWADIVPNKARRKLVGAYTDPPETRYQAILGADGRPVSDPVPVTLAGVPITDSSIKALVFYHYDYADFAALGL